jgi:probable selenium-dependent hydroxylase accessory protein YqeC
VRLDLKTSAVDSLGVCAGDLVSIVGAGGKTSLMYRLGRDLSRIGVTTVLTTTTRIMYPGPNQVCRVILGEETDSTIRRVSSSLHQNALVLAARRRDDSKIIGYSTGFVERLHSGGGQWTLVAECDGAMGKSLKVPRNGEPPLAGTTGVYVVVLGADCLGKRISSERIFNPERVASVAGVNGDSVVDEDVVASTVVSEESYLGHKPQKARLCVFVNKVDAGFRQMSDSGSNAGRVSVVGLALTLIRHPMVERVVLGCLHSGQDNTFLVIKE